MILNDKLINVLKAFLFFFLLYLSEINLANANQSILVLDARNANELPLRFRITSPIIKYTQVNWTGFDKLKIIGSGQFSKFHLENVLKTLKTRDIVILDLRQEPHLFLNGNAISWFADHNAANANKTLDEMNAFEDNLVKQVQKISFIRIHKIIAKNSENIIQKTKKIEYPIRNAFDESNLANSYGLSYKRIPVQDYHLPSDVQVDAFVDLIKTLPKNKWIYMHCRGGVGRTTTFMAMYDILKNAHEVSLDQILERQAIIGGKDLKQVNELNKFKTILSIKHLEFLKLFYRYSLDNNQTPWSIWIKDHKNVS